MGAENSAAPVARLFEITARSALPDAASEARALARALEKRVSLLTTVGAPLAFTTARQQGQSHTNCRALVIADLISLRRIWREPYRQSWRTILSDNIAVNRSNHRRPSASSLCEAPFATTGALVHGREPSCMNVISLAVM